MLFRTVVDPQSDTRPHLLGEFDRLTFSNVPHSRGFFLEGL